MSEDECRATYESSGHLWTGARDGDDRPMGYDICGKCGGDRSDLEGEPQEEEDAKEQHMTSPWTEYGDCLKCAKAVALINPRHGDGTVRHTRWHKNPEGDWCRSEVEDGWRKTRTTP